MRVSGRVLLSVLLLVTSVTSILQAQPASAAQITTRSLELQTNGTTGGSTPAGVVNHKFSFTAPGSVQSVKFDYCNNPDPANCGGVPATMVTTSATLSDQTGTTGWTVGAVSPVNGSPYLTRGTATTLSGVSFTLAGVTNPTAVNTTFYVHIKTYASADRSGSPVDEGVVAASTARVILVNGTMPESLIFCTAATIDTIDSEVDGVPDCTTATEGTVNFNQLFSPIATATATSQMAASTNAVSGYVITLTGTTLTTGGSVTIPAIGNTAAASSPGTGQFGLNLVDNATPNVGAPIAAASGAANYQARPLTGFGTADQFRFDTAAVNSIADSGFDTTPGPTDGQIYTVSYIANVSGSQTAGDYVATLTYICTPTF